MRWCAGALLGAALMAQQQAPDGFVRGTLLEWDNAPVGDLSVRVKDNHVYCFRFDGATDIERDGLRLPFSGLKKGDAVEIMPEPGPDPSLPRAKTVRVVAGRPDPSQAGSADPVPSNLLDDLFPRGDMTFAGVVTRVALGRMVLRTRAQGNKEILLRSDTRYFNDGREVLFSILKVNAHVFVRGGHNLDDDIEAYQVMWGAILQPGRRDPAPSLPVPQRAANHLLY
jgi:hypothetical protein